MVSTREVVRRAILGALFLVAVAACEGKARLRPSITSAGSAGVDAAGGASASGGSAGVPSRGGSSGFRVTGSVGTFGAGTRSPRDYVLTRQTLLELLRACGAEHCVSGRLEP